MLLVDRPECYYVPGLADRGENRSSAWNRTRLSAAIRGEWPAANGQIRSHEPTDRILVIASDPVQGKLRESLASRAQQRSWHVQPVSANSLSTEPSVDGISSSASGSMRSPPDFAQLTILKGSGNGTSVYGS
jgi:hypothetical protein